MKEVLSLVAVVVAVVAMIVVAIMGVELHRVQADLAQARQILESANISGESGLAFQIATLDALAKSAPEGKPVVGMAWENPVTFTKTTTEDGGRKITIDFSPSYVDKFKVESKRWPGYESKLNPLLPTTSWVFSR